MNQARLKTYPMTTTMAKPGAVRLPNTLHEHFVKNPFGCTSFKSFFLLFKQYKDLETFLAKWHDYSPNIVEIEWREKQFANHQNGLE